MYPERIADFFNEQADLRERQLGAQAIESVQVDTIEEVQEWYGNLVERILELPTYGERSTELSDGTPYLDRRFHTEIETGNVGFPRVQITIHTGHVLTATGAIKDRRDSSDISVDWMPTESTRDSGRGGAPSYGYKESLSRPNEHTDVEKACRALGLLEESVTAAEDAIATKSASIEA